MSGERFPVVSLTGVAANGTGFIGGPFGSSLGRRDYVDSGVPVVRGGNLTTSQASFEDAVYVTEEKADSLSRCVAVAGDIVVTQRGTIGQVAILNDEFDRYLVSQSQMALRVDPVVADGRFVLAAMRAPDFRRQMTDRAIVTGVPHLNLAIFKTLELPLPELVEQRRIASVLAALDEKIESNRRMAASARRVLMHAAPATGDTASLASVASFRNGGALTRLANGDGRPILRIKELRAGVSADTPRTDDPQADQHAVGDGEILFSWSGTLLTRRWTGGPSVLNQHIFRVTPAERFPRWLVEAWIQQHLSTFRQIAADKATTMGHIQRHHLTEAQVLVPGAVALADLRSSFDSLDALRISALKEARTLTAIWDALLPKLVSGEIRVPLSDDAEEQIGGATEELA